MKLSQNCVLLILLLAVTALIDYISESAQPEEFQGTNFILFDDIQGVEIYFYYFIVGGRTKEEYDHLFKVLERAQSSNIKFNPETFHFRLNEVKCMGLSISKDGIKADASHVKVINELEKPSCKRDMKRILGMINFLSKF